MKQIFLISTNPGGYEEQSVIVGFTKTEQDAQAAVDKLTLNYRTALNFYNNTIIPALRKFREETPNTNSYNDRLEEIPKWPAGISQKDITPAMCEERDAIKLRNQLAIEEYSRQEKAYRILEMKSLELVIGFHQDKEWFREFFDVGEQHITCKAGHLVENNEYYFEPCEEL